LNFALFPIFTAAVHDEELAAHSPENLKFLQGFSKN
jgi:hypothetical protein